MAPPRPPAEKLQSRELALSLVSAGAPRGLVLRTLKAELGLTKVQADLDYQSVCAELQEEFAENRASMKAQQVQRLMTDLAKMRAPANGQQVSYRSIAQHEALLARITGTLEPVRIEAHIEAELQQSLLAVVAGLNPAEQDRLIEEQMSLELRAGKREAPALEAHGEEVPTD